jgi:hypothetical protein
MKILTLALVALISAATGAMALQYSQRHLVDRAIEAIKMADALAAGTPQAISCSIHLAPIPGGFGSARGRAIPQVTIDSGTVYNNLLSAMTTKLNNDKATAEAYLASVGVTND